MKTRLLFILGMGVLSIVALLFSLLIPQYPFLSGNTSLWLFLSNAGSVFGTAFILFLVSIIIAFGSSSKTRGSLTFVSFFCSISFILGLSAKSNEDLLKEEVHVARPYTFYLEEQFHFNKQEFYSYPTRHERRSFLKAFILDKKVETVIEKEIAEHWIEETGFSFPSGHTLTAFLFVTLVAYSLLFVFPNKLTKGVIVVLYIWATLIGYSRIFVGAHSAKDIVIGALIGFTVASLILLSQIPEKLLGRINRSI